MKIIIFVFSKSIIDINQRQPFMEIVSLYYGLDHQYFVMPCDQRRPFSILIYARNESTLKSFHPCLYSVISNLSGKNDCIFMKFG